MNRMSRTAALATLAVISLSLTACGSDDSAPTKGGASADGTADKGSKLDLSDVCPATVVMQQDWQPEAEQGAMYHLIGKDYTVDTNKKTVTGPLVAGGVDTGVKIEVRSGGPAVNFQPVPALMYLDKDILIGAVNTDAAIAAPKQPTVAVTAQMTNSPQALMWDPKSQKDAKTIKEAAADGDPVVSAGELIPGLLVAKGIMKKSQSDESYEGTPQRFVSDPKILQQAFATAEPYIYEKEVPQWGKKISFQLLSEVGYSIYPEPIAVRKDDVVSKKACLAKLVPIMQQAQIDYLAHPDHANDVIVDIVEKYQTGWTYSAGVADYAAKTMKALDIVTNDPDSGVFGKIDPDRMQDIVDTFGPILLKAGTIKNAEIDPKSLYTNEFIDTSISLKD